ncbi:hypothetical protein CROQUDRAFT_668348 [Cronartium quercuum f. sp. fusiforme G11]|uniref:Aspartate-semialdehyde dehydrogenase n=1 Tax=Cronartium quercuum f. sp. fusiforme G11 TaxID=708437 RepID=A0A9P6THF1_9BASI|nr:hypothetical protein CROQUDRAFT_668348 [Cronartium quercuum f. sp. fusiforme G11]
MDPNSYPKDCFKKVGVLGATGTVGQRFIVLLSKHPSFKLIKIGASSRSAGKTYSECVRWKQSVPIPESVRGMVVQECVPEYFEGCDIIFSGLDADVAGEIELSFRAHELAVFSNAKNHRRDEQCPLVVPLVNPSHLDLIPHQRAHHVHPTTQKSMPLSKGFIVTNANCSTTGLAVPFKALELAFGPIDRVFVTTLQAISGGGYPGVPSLDVLDNVVPYISGEEEKIEWELCKILGAFESHPPKIHHRQAGTPENLKCGPIHVSATTTRVPVLDGHTAIVSVSFADGHKPTPEKCVEAFRKFGTEARTLGCPSAPAEAIHVHDEPDRPQPRLDRYFQDGAGVNVGRVRECNVLGIKFVVLSNNVSIGAATSSVMNAELAVAKGLV